MSVRYAGEVDTNMYFSEVLSQRLQDKLQQENDDLKKEILILKAENEELKKLISAKTALECNK